ncbi:ketopantoate reductase family protein [Micromonospora sp. NBC_01699]|uniref:ketopantoate reductase family protein n=1 Tax=Micromonospora sp. NBC_01699 TaxID=2975984 RepID=UPI002E27D1F3|nr:2-dehydropantoate 2-reductase N-terminal domain-containing protein [Micromonospora sp. NBC_01699]
MRYVIIGAGAVGGTIGVRLALAGHDVTLVARGAQLDALRSRGLTLATPDGEQTVALPAVGGPAELELTPDTTLVLTVKSQDTQTALGDWAGTPVTGGGTAADRLPLLTAQNGVANERAALRRFDRVHPVCLWLPATFLEPGVIAAEGHPHSGMLQLGGYPSGADDTVRQVADELSESGFVTRVRDDVMRWKYGKLLANLGNGLDALFGRDADPELAERLRAEGIGALAAAGIAHTSRAEEAADRADNVRAKPVAGRERAGSSTWQSLARGTGSTETDYLNGEIVLLGRLHGVPTPVNAAVQRAVRRAVRERIPAGGFPPAQLLP